MADQSLTRHPAYSAALEAANCYVQEAIKAMGCSNRHVSGHEAEASSMMDGFIKLLLHAYDAKNGEKKRRRA